MGVLSYEVGAQFTILDRASPALLRMSELAERLDGLVSGLVDRFAALSDVRFTGLNRSLGLLADRMEKLAPAADKMGSQLDDALTTIAGSAERAAAAMGALADASKATMAAAGRGVGAAAAAAGGAGAGGGGRGIVRRAFFGRNPHGHPGVREAEKWGGLGLLGAMALGTYEQAALSTTVGRMVVGASAPASQKGTIERAIQRVSVQTGMPLQEAAKASLLFYQQTPQLSAAQHLALLPTMLKAAFVEGALKNISPEAATEAMVGLLHTAGAYTPQAMHGLMMQMAAASPLTSTSLSGIKTAATYTLPGAQLLGISNLTTLGLITTLLQRGIKPSRVGTSMHALLALANPQASIMAQLTGRGAAVKLVDLARLGLVSPGGQPTGLKWLQQGNLTAFFKTLREHIKAIPRGDREAIINTALGTRGGRVLEAMSQSSFLTALSGNVQRIGSFGAGGFDQLVKTILTEMPFAAMRKAEQAVVNLLARLGSVLLPTLIKAINNLTATLDSVYGLKTRVSLRTVGSDIATGAATGAALGSILPGIGTGIGAVAGGVAGAGVGLWGYAMAGRGGGGGAFRMTTASRAALGSYYAYLANHEHLSRPQALAMVANIAAESGGNPGAIGDHGTSGGLFQFHGPLFARMRAAVPGWATNPQGQLAFMVAYARAHDAAFFGSGASAAGLTEQFTYNVERPHDAFRKARQRALIADALSAQGFGAAHDQIESDAAPRIENLHVHVNSDSVDPEEHGRKVADSLVRHLKRAHLHDQGQGWGTNFSPWEVGAGTP